MSAASSHLQAWMDPENVGGTTYFYPHHHHHHPGGGGGAVVEDGQNCVDVVPGVGDPMEDPAAAAGAMIFPSYSMFSGQPPPHLKDHSGLGGGPTGNGAGGGGGGGGGITGGNGVSGQSGGGTDPASRIQNLGPPTQNSVVHPPPILQNHTSFFVPDEVKVELMHRSAVLHSQANPNLFQDLPAQIDHYHEVCPLENTHHQKSSSFGYPSTVYKAVNSRNGFTYCLRRIHGFRLPSGKWLGIIEAWKQLNHCNLIQLREIFTTKAFGDNSLIFVYDYFPTADTLMARHFHRNNQVNGYVDPFTAGDPAVPRPYSHQRNSLLKHQANLLPENLLWAYIVQLSSVIRTIHTAGLAVRSLDPTKVLVTSRTRPSIRLNCCGVLDVITYDPNANHATLTPFYQQEDLVAFGKLILALSCNSLLAVQRENLQTSMELIGRSYSSDLRNLIIHLMNPRGAQSRSINDIMPMIGARFYNQLDSANARAELLEHHLAKEIENGRLFRLLVKMNTIIGRQDLNQDPQWAETGDRYLLKLFRDYVFHQVSADGRPWLDMSHVVYTLNRLDAGTVEKVCLMSRDEQNVLITSYAELKQCMEQSFGEILSSAAIGTGAGVNSSTNSGSASNAVNSTTPLPISMPHAQHSSSSVASSPAGSSVTAAVTSAQAITNNVVSNNSIILNSTPTPVAMSAATGS